MFVRKFFWEILSVIFIIIACAFALLYVQRVYLFKSIGWYQKGHIVADLPVLESYYKAHGGPALLTYTKQRAWTLSVANRHSIGHAVGEVLFEHEGLDAVATCGGAFEWGCLHQVLGRAYTVYGPSTLTRLENDCGAKSNARERGQCEHGLGHGLMYESAYDPAKMESVMQACDRITKTNPLPWNDSCHAGAMMEFNEHFIAMDYVGENGRPASTTAPFEACNGVAAGPHREMCVFWTIPWLHGKLFNFTYADPSAFTTLGSYCDNLTTTRLRHVCFQSIGRSVGVNADLPPERVVQLCGAASSAVEYARDCVEFAANTYALEGKIQGAALICANVAEDPTRACRPGTLAP